MTGRTVRTLVAAGFALTLVAGCSEADTQGAVDRARDEASSAAGDVDLPDLDLGKYSDKLRDRLNNFTDDADCSSLERELDKAEGSDSELADYIRDLLDKLDC